MIVILIAINEFKQTKTKTSYNMEKPKKKKKICSFLSLTRINIIQNTRREGEIQSKWKNFQDFRFYFSEFENGNHTIFFQNWNIIFFSLVYFAVKMMILSLNFLLFTCGSDYYLNLCCLKYNLVFFLVERMHNINSRKLNNFIGNQMCAFCVIIFKYNVFRIINQTTTTTINK